ncbi:hypothetical protein HaLaN_28239 [Haematococcus lacustris]|uniref:Uncharacterized protein n=1 Tax=Haematococcus lacustris TaxID=44745 RepID=A0A6A0AA30_HAELA|nr:hypothetical protein HaLaN_28239 [Haematococcus lacustris]
MAARVTVRLLQHSAGWQRGNSQVWCCSRAPASTANERVFSAFSHVWSDKRASLILGRMWGMAYIYEWEEYERCWMAAGTTLTSVAHDMGADSLHA